MWNITIESLYMTSLLPSLRSCVLLALVQPWSSSLMCFLLASLESKATGISSLSSPWWWGGIKKIQAQPPSKMCSWNHEINNYDRCLPSQLCCHIVHVVKEFCLLTAWLMPQVCVVSASLVQLSVVNDNLGLTRNLHNILCFFNPLYPLMGCLNCITRVGAQPGQPGGFSVVSLSAFLSLNLD